MNSPILALGAPLSLALAALHFGQLPGQSSHGSPSEGERPEGLAPGAVDIAFHWGDFDADGLDDALLLDAVGTVTLLRSVGNGTLEDVTAAVGLDGVTHARFALWQDYDQDGQLDLFLGTSEGPAHLLQNQAGFFADVAGESGITVPGAHRSAHWVDYDSDGLLDLHLVSVRKNTLYHATGGGAFESIELPELLQTNLAVVGSGAAQPGPGADAPATPGRPGRADGRAGLPSAGGSSSITNGSAGIPVATSAPRQESTLALPCAPSIANMGGGGCLQASSAAMLGMLYPLSDKLFVDEGTGNVGIGTLSPASQLDVSGHARLGGSSSTSHFRIEGNQIQQYFGSNPANMYLNGLGGNVGIGTNTSSAKLDVVGSARVDGPVTFTGTTASLHLDGQYANLFVDRASTSEESVVRFQTAGTDEWLIGTDNVPFGNSSDFSIKRTQNEDPELVVTTGGNVGIGTTTPGSRLQVRGTVSMGDLVGFGHHMVSARVEASNTVQDLALFASNDRTTGGVSGLVAQTADPTGLGVLCGGDLLATGVKNFAQPHPDDAAKEIRFVSLEGNESGTYFRGKTQIVDGRAKIEVPEDFRLVTDSAGLTVQLTAVGDARVWVDHYDLNEIEVLGSADIEVHYVVQGVRRGFSDYQTIRNNVAYRPMVRGKAYGTQYPQELRDILVANGTLNPDYTPNEATAARLGWKLVDPQGQQAMVEEESLSVD